MKILIVDNDPERAEAMKAAVVHAGYSYNFTGRNLLYASLLERVDACVVNGDIPGAGVLSLLNQIETIAKDMKRNLPTLVLGNTFLAQAGGVFRFDLRQIQKVFHFSEFQLREEDPLAHLTEFLHRVSKIPKP